MFATHATNQMPSTACRIAADRQAGLTLIELMIAMTIGVFLLMGTLTVFTQSRANFKVADSIARLQENARFALDTIEPDLRLAGFWGRTSAVGTIDATSAGVVVTCDTLDNSPDYTAWTLNLQQKIWAVDEGSGYTDPVLGIPCSAANGAQAESDALVVRHAAALALAPVAGTIQVHGELNSGELLDNGIIPAGYVAWAQTRNVVANVYYVDQGSDLDPDVPSLRIKTLMPGGIHQDQELISGVENLQVQFGVDTTIPNDGIVDRYVDADHNIINPTTPGTIVGANVIAVRLWMLMRADAQENGFQDQATYLTPDQNLNVQTCAQGANCGYPDNFRRLAVSKTIFLRNTQ